MTSQDAYRKADNLQSQANRLRNMDAQTQHEIDANYRAAAQLEQESRAWYTQAQAFAVQGK
jgi:hypothetical protein